MPTIMDVLFGDFAQAKRDETLLAQQAQLSENIGQQARPGVSEGGGPLRSQPATGIFTAPEEDQAIQQGLVTLGSPGFSADGSRLLGQALRQQSDIVQEESMFRREQAQRDDQFKSTDKLAQDKWISKKAIDTADRFERGQRHIQELTLNKQEIAEGKQDVLTAERNREIAEVTLERLPPAQLKSILTDTNTLEQMQGNIQRYKKGFAWNTKTKLGADGDRAFLARKPNKSEYDLEKLEFWRDVDSYTSYLLSEQSGAAINAEEFKRWSGLLPTHTMDDNQIDRNMRILHREIGNRLQLKAKAAIFGERKDPTELFEDALEVGPGGKFGSANQLPESVGDAADLEKLGFKRVAGPPGQQNPRGR